MGKKSEISLEELKDKGSQDRKKLEFSRGYWGSKKELLLEIFEDYMVREII